MNIVANVSSKQIVEKINNTFFLPPIQRGFVWPIEKIEALFDSLYHEYPVGIPIVWQIKKWTKKICPLCSFYHEAEGDETVLKEALNVSKDKKYYVVLDGQQRLSSLYLGLKGWITTKKKGRGLQNIKDNFERRYLCFNLAGKDFDVSKKSIDEDDVSIPLFKFKTDDDIKEWQKNNFWVKLQEFDERYSGLTEFIKDLKKRIPLNLQKSSRKIEFRSKLKKLYDTIYIKPLCYFEVSFDSMNEITEIFARVNTKGTQLAKAELLVSRIISEWTEGKDFIDRETRMLKNNLSLSRAQDFVMRSMLYINDLPVRYNLAAFSKKRIKLIQQKENRKKIEDSLSLLINERNQYGYTKGLSENTLLPIAYYLMKQKGKISKSEWKEIKKYYVISSAFGLFSGSSDTTLGQMRKVIQFCVKSKKKFSIDYLKKQNQSEEIRKFFSFNEDDLKDFLELPVYRHNRNLAQLLLWVVSDDSSGTTIANGQIDHIHPESTIKDDALIDRKDSLLNLELLSADFNQSKNDEPLADFLNDKSRFPINTKAGRDKRNRFLKNHFISRKERLWKLKNFNEFCDDRKKILLKKLKPLFDLK